MASSLISKIAKLAASPQGRQVISRAKNFASKPENKAKIEQAVRRIRSMGAGPTAH